MARPKKVKTLSQLRTEWYKKLEKSGFEDIEQDEYKLKKWSRSTGYYYRQRDIKNFFIRQEYYYRAQHFLNEYRFDSRLEATIWEYHTEGLSAREIAKILKKARINNMGYGSVWKVINKLKKAMVSYYFQPEARHE